eukprot:m.104852 g.104852  ORF g.104852 m.104852 type:complete len:402 (-) comp22464_c0_seq3:86-1291(-)
MAANVELVPELDEKGVDALSPTQRDFLDNLKHEFEGRLVLPRNDDTYLIRFACARDWKLAATIKMIDENLRYMKEIDQPTFLDRWKFSESLLKYCPNTWYGEDRQGRPIFWMAPGAIDCKGLMRACKRDEVRMARSVVLGEQALRFMAEASKKHGRPIARINVVCDLANVGMADLYRPWVSVVTECLKVFDHHYPQTLARTLVFNPPRIFPVAYAICKPFMSQRTREKLVLISGSNYQAELQKYIDPQYIPKRWGGQADDSCVPLPQRVPPEAYLSESANLDGATTITVGRGSSHQVELEVTTDKATLRWEFMTKSYDIAYGLFWKPLDVEGKIHKGEMEEILNSQRVDSNLTPESGLHECTKSGKYVLRFDNTYSWTRAKEVQYTFEVLPPAETELPTGE